ncbi:MAG: MarR family winged helix-turn-helix transcriptional regulator [Anaerovoracaceae bacterium]|jgi:DNA-binding MarR family transcriptional regulator
MKRTVGGMIKQINDTLVKEANNDLRPIGLTLSQHAMLLVLFEAPDGRLTMKELERGLHVAQPTAAGIAARLEKKNLVESSGTPEDKRVKIVAITEKGREICRDSIVHMGETERKLLSPLSEEEQKTLLDLLEKVSDAAVERQ